MRASLPVVLCLAACTTQTHAPLSAEFRIPDGEWELATSSFVESGRLPGVPRAKLAIRDGRLSAFSGCNSATGAVRDNAGRLDTIDLVATQRACPEPLGLFDSRFFRLLRAQPVYRVEGDVLTIAANEHSARFRRATATR